MKAMSEFLEITAASGGKSGWFATLLGGGGTSAAARPKPASKASPKAVARPAAVRKPASAPPTSVADLKAKGYVMKGVISKENTASKIAKGKWNAADTYYTIRNKVFPGTAIDEAHIEKGMCVWMKK